MIFLSVGLIKNRQQIVDSTMNPNTFLAQNKVLNLEVVVIMQILENGFSLCAEVQQEKFGESTSHAIVANCCCR